MKIQYWPKPMRRVFLNWLFIVLFMNMGFEIVVVLTSGQVDVKKPLTSSDQCPSAKSSTLTLYFSTSLWLSLALTLSLRQCPQTLLSQKMSTLCAKVLRCLWRWRITLSSIQATTISHLREDSTPTEGISNQQSVSIWHRKHLFSNRCYASQPWASTLPRWAWCRIKNDFGLISRMNMNFYHRNEIMQMIVGSFSPQFQIIVLVYEIIF